MNSPSSAIYIVANKRNGTIYTGVTSNLLKRLYQHRHGVCEGFSKTYQCKILVYFEMHLDIMSAIEREKQLKGGSRKKKIALIESVNPNWIDLYPTLF